MENTLNDYLSSANFLPTDPYKYNRLINSLHWNTAPAFLCKEYLYLLTKILSPVIKYNQNIVDAALTPLTAQYKTVTHNTIYETTGERINCFVTNGYKGASLPRPPRITLNKKHTEIMENALKSSGIPTPIKNNEVERYIRDAMDTLTTPEQYVLAFPGVSPDTFSGMRCMKENSDSFVSRLHSVESAENIVKRFQLEHPEGTKILKSYLSYGLLL